MMVKSKGRLALDPTTSYSFPIKDNLYMLVLQAMKMEVTDGYVLFRGRIWEFCVGLYMVSFCLDSLLLAAVYGVMESASTALFGPLIGR